MLLLLVPPPLLLAAVLLLSRLMPIVLLFVAALGATAEVNDDACAVCVAADVDVVHCMLHIAGSFV